MTKKNPECTPMIDPLTHLLNQAKDPLPSSQQKELVRLAKKGNVEARNTLITSYLRLFARLASRFAEQSWDKYVTIDDLIDEGVPACIRAINTYDESRGTEFSTHMTKVVCNAMRQYIRYEKHRHMEQESMDETEEGDCRSPLEDIPGRWDGERQVDARDTHRRIVDLMCKHLQGSETLRNRDTYIVDQYLKLGRDKPPKLEDVAGLVGMRGRARVQQIIKDAKKALPPELIEEACAVA